MYQLPVFLLFALVLSTSFVYSEAVDPNSEGNCQFNQIEIAALSCQHHNGSSKLPSDSCCKSLLHAVDEIPPVGESGECCLCRYTKIRLFTYKLATSYISCYGKDRANVAKWIYPIETCDEACNKKNVLPRMDTHVKKDLQDGHGSRKIKILVVEVLFLVLLVGSVCFCWVWKPAKSSGMQQRETSSEAGSQTESRRSSIQPKGVKYSRTRRRSFPASPGVGV